jgi:hypothetical protein
MGLTDVIGTLNAQLVEDDPGTCRVTPTQAPAAPQ